MGQDLTGYRIIGELADLVVAGRSVVLATVVDTERSVPRRSGAKMLVFPDGSTSGSIGGGEMEARVVSEARACFDDRRNRILDYTLLDPAGGDPGVCGGQVQLYLEVYMPAPTLYVIGCGHIGRAVVQLGDWLGFRIVAYDDRVELLEGLEGADVSLSGSIADAVAAEPITSETHVIVVTRNTKVDLEILPVILGSPARTIGVMGSRRRWQVTREQLAASGVLPESLDRVLNPIGLELNAETPEEIAVSILAQVIGARRSDAVS
ncbi:MAG: XdhC/CoxI family protein [Acidimicrobiia bacterium]|nr:XdhC/CoxI family protein [Acidimicrobiia bacterium]MDH4309402.1 XdhC/CoxI family protein [Acidimicrobiia bacterium]